MPHKADASFFNQKRPWSNRKDLILREYLKPYLPKVAYALNKPILVVDGFAGPGRYGDGSEGSPRIICDIVQQARGNVPVDISVLCMEQDEALQSRLTDALQDFPFAAMRRGTFLEHLPEVERCARTHTVFLYVDPYAIEGLEWASMDSVFRYVQNNGSIEVLINFAADKFVRRALAAMKQTPPPADEEEPDASADPPSIQRLNAAVGGDWWQNIIRTEDDYARQIKAIADGFCQRLAERFPEVCSHPIRAKATDSIPKYWLIFGSRSSVALVLMNDATIQSRDQLAVEALPPEGTLFEVRSVELVPDRSTLTEIVLAAADSKMKRAALIAKIIRAHFCTFTQKEIRAAIGSLLKQGLMLSEGGKTQINDATKVWRR